MNPLVSVVIPAHNAQDHIEDCLASVYRQRGDLPLEVIVVDDGSTDGTLERLRAHPGLIALQQANRGPAAARNAAIGRARGEYVAFLDADDLWPEGKLQNQIELLRRHPDAALCFGDCRQFEGSRWWPRTLFEEGGPGSPAPGSGPYLPDAYARLLQANFITTGSVVVRRRTLDAAGGFDEGLRLVEDLDLWLRIALRHPIIWCGEVCLLRRRHPANASRDPDAMSLAYLEVLKRQQACCGAELARLGIDLNALFAREYGEMAQRALRDRRAKDALGWAWRGFAARPGPRALWRLAQGAGRRVLARTGR